MTPLIFLDFDGVLNDRHWQADYRQRKYVNPSIPASAAFKMDCIERVNQLLIASNADVVISSAWRFSYSLNELRMILCDVGFFDERIIDAITPFDDDNRGLRIREWLDGHYEDEDPPFIVIDDYDHDMDPVAGHGIRTDNNAGITSVDVGRAIHVLREMEVGR